MQESIVTEHQKEPPATSLLELPTFRQSPRKLSSSECLVDSERELIGRANFDVEALNMDELKKEIELEAQNDLTADNSFTEEDPKEDPQSQSYKLPTPKITSTFIDENMEGLEKALNSKSRDSSESDTANAEEYFFLSEDIKSLPRKKTMRVMARMVASGVVLSTTNLSMQLIQSLAMILLNLMQDNSSQATLGLALSFNVIFYFGFFLAFVEKLGIDLSKSFGASNYRENKKVFTQGLLTASLWVLILLTPIFMAGGSILKFMNIEENMASRVQALLPLMLIANVVELAGDIFRNFCMAQGHENVFGKTSIVAMMVALAFETFFILVLELGAGGFFLAKLLFESFALCIAIWVYLRRTDPKTRGFVSFREALPGLGHFNLVSFKFAMGNYTEFIGYELTSYFVFLSKNESHIAAYSSIMNFMTMFYSVGEIFAVVCRTRMNLLLGKGLWKAAKNLYILFVASVFLFGCCLSLLFFLLRDKLSALYAGTDPEMKATFETLFLTYCAVIPSDLTMITVFVGVKTIGYINCLLLTNIFYIILLNGVVSYCISSFTDWGVCALFASLTCIFYSVNCCAFLGAVIKSWKDAQPEEE